MHLKVVTAIAVLCSMAAATVLEGLSELNLVRSVTQCVFAKAGSDCAIGISDSNFGEIAKRTKSPIEWVDQETKIRRHVPSIAHDVGRLQQRRAQRREKQSPTEWVDQKTNIKWHVPSIAHDVGRLQQRLAQRREKNRTRRRIPMAFGACGSPYHCSGCLRDCSIIRLAEAANATPDAPPPSKTTQPEVALEISAASLTLPLRLGPPRSPQTGAAAEFSRWPERIACVACVANLSLVDGPPPEESPARMLETASLSTSATNSQGSASEYRFATLGKLVGGLVTLGIIAFVAELYRNLARRSRLLSQQSPLRRRASTASTIYWNDETEEFETNLELKEKSYFACKLHKLNDECFDEPHDQRNWRTRDVWIGRQGVLYYYSNKDNRASVMFNELSIGRLHVKCLGRDEACYPLCLSIAFPPFDNPDHDPNPTWFGTDSQDDLLSILRAHDHFKNLVQIRSKAVFAAKVMKLNSDAVNDPFHEGHWRKRDIWIGTDGLMYYYSFKDSQIECFFAIQSIGELIVEVMPPNATCYPFNMKLATPDSEHIVIFGTHEEQVVTGFLTVWKGFASAISSSEQNPRRSS